MHYTTANCLIQAQILEFRLIILFSLSASCFRVVKDGKCWTLSSQTLMSLSVLAYAPYVILPVVRSEQSQLSNKDNYFGGSFMLQIFISLPRVFLCLVTPSWESTSFLGCNDLCVYNVSSVSKQSVGGECCSIDIFIIHSCDGNIISLTPWSLSILRFSVIHFAEILKKYWVCCFSDR